MCNRQIFCKVCEDPSWGIPGEAYGWSPTLLITVAPAMVGEWLGQHGRKAESVGTKGLYSDLLSIFIGDEYLSRRA